MKALSLWQPWASLWACTDLKTHETRGWKTERRGWILVHAAKLQVCHALEKGFSDSDDDMARMRDILIQQWGARWAQTLPRGALLGAIYLADVMLTETVKHNLEDSIDFHDRFLGNFEAGRYAWRKSAFHFFAEPIPFKGRQNIFDVPDSVVAGLIPEGKRA